MCRRNKDPPTYPLSCSEIAGEYALPNFDLVKIININKKKKNNLISKYLLGSLRLSTIRFLYNGIIVDIMLLPFGRGTFSSDWFRLKPFGASMIIYSPFIQQISIEFLLHTGNH